MNEFIAVMVFLALCGSIALLITWLISSGVELWISILVAFILFQVLFFAVLKTVYPPSDKEKRHD